MRAISILYHDVIANGDYEASGFSGPGAAVYKLDRADFEEHLAAIARAISCPPISVLVGRQPTEEPDPLFLTFDDGGVSAISLIADQLEKYSWVGHFFITAKRIDSPAFLSKEQIRELYRRGHIVGSHSYSHPPRMSSCNWDTLVEEWKRSVQILSDIVGKRVSVASVPGGYSSEMVVRAAAAVGIRTLFTSEPTTKCHFLDGCLVLGRYTVRRGTRASLAASYASARLVPCIRQSLLWNVMKIPKFVGGEYYSKLREAWLR